MREQEKEDEGENSSRMASIIEDENFLDPHERMGSLPCSMTSHRHEEQRLGDLQGKDKIQMTGSVEEK